MCGSMPMSSKSILLKCIYVCGKDLHVPLERRRSICMWNVEVPHGTQFHTYIYSCIARGNSVPHTYIERRTYIYSCISLYMYVGRTCVSDDVCDDLRLSRCMWGEPASLRLCMWGGPASLYMYVGRSYISLHVCGKDLRLSICLWGETM